MSAGGSADGAAAGAVSSTTLLIVGIVGGLLCIYLSGFLGDAESAIVIFVVITMNAILGTVQTLKAEQSLNSLKQLSAPEAKVIRDGVLMQIPSREVTIGDEVIINNKLFHIKKGKAKK